MNPKFQKTKVQGSKFKSAPKWKTVWITKNFLHNKTIYTLFASWRLSRKSIITINFLELLRLECLFANDLPVLIIVYHYGNACLFNMTFGKIQWRFPVAQVDDITVLQR